MEPCVTTLVRIGLKWAVEYGPPGCFRMTTELAFWRKSSAKSMADVIEAAYRDGLDVGRGALDAEVS